MPIHPTDVLLASARLYSSLPVIGKHLEPFAGLTAMALYGGHYAPAAMRAAVTRRTGWGLPKHDNEPEVAPVATAGSRIPPFVRASGQRRRCLHSRAVQYGDHSAQLLDVWRRPDLPPGAPVLLFVPGAAWARGARFRRAPRFLSHLVRRGWVYLTRDFRVSRVHGCPRHIADVNAAIAWARANV